MEVFVLCGVGFVYIELGDFLSVCVVYFVLQKIDFDSKIVRNELIYIDQLEQVVGWCLFILFY